MAPAEPVVEEACSAGLLTKEQLPRAVLKHVMVVFQVIVRLHCNQAWHPYVLHALVVVSMFVS
jgi:hypothetical protein